MNAIILNRMKLIGRGIFTWEGNERRSNRYGSFNLMNENYDSDATAEVFLDEKEIKNFRNQRVKLTAVVTQSRDSGHCGDVFFGCISVSPQCY